MILESAGSKEQDVRYEGLVAAAAQRAWNSLVKTITLVPGGRTCHATFGFPVPLPSANVTSSIAYQSGRAELLRRADIIFWDEAPMSPTEAVTGAHPN